MSGLSPGPWHLLTMVMVLVCWMGSLAAAQDEISALQVHNQTKNSVTLKWERTNETVLNYNITWAKDSQLIGTGDTSDTQYTVKDLDPGTTYEFTVKEEGSSSSGKSLNASTLPNEVGDLRMDARSNSSVTLKWEAPSGPQPANYTYYVSWTGDGVLLDEVNTKQTEYMVDNLDAATVYNFTVRAERNGVNSSAESIQVATVPNEVGDLRMDARSNSSVTLKWEAPSGPQPANYTYYVSWTGDGVLLDEVNTKQTEYMVDNLDAATVYNFTVRAERNGVNSSAESIQVATVPNEVGDLRMDARSNSSVTLKWEAPSGPQPANYTYYVSWTGDGVLLDEVNTKQTEYMVDNLDAATVYNFTVRAERNGVNSSAESIQVATVPNEVGDLRMDARSNSSVTLKWEAPSGPQPANYTYYVSWTGDGVLLDEVNTKQTEYMVDNLDAATVYNFTVRAERNGVNSSAESIQVATVPNEVGDLRMDARSNSSVTLKWEAPSGPQPANYTYYVSWTGDGVLLDEVNTKQTEYMVDNLDAATVYNFTVRAERNGVNSSAESIQVATVPNEVRYFRMAARSNSSVTLKWEAPSGPRSANYTYYVSWIRDGVPIGAASTMAEEYTAEDLGPGSLYVFTVCSMSNEVNSSVQMLQVFTVPSEVRSLKLVTQTNSSIAFKWVAPEGHTGLMYNVSWSLSETQEHQVFTTETNFTAEGLTPGTWYQFLVRSMTEDEAQSPERAVNASTAPGAVTITSCASAAAGYEVVLTLACPAGNQESFEFEAGSHRGTWPGPCSSPRSVGGLQPAQAYRVMVRSLWAGMNATSASVTCYTESGGVIAGAIVGIFLFILLLGLLVFFLHRRNRRKTVQEKPQTTDVAFSNLGDISAENLAAYVKEHQKDSNYGFAEEYQQLTLEGTGQMQTAALTLENKSKNRFSNVLPYDWSRVPLKPIPDDPSSDYINASFIPGFFGPREYIATQGPLPQTVGDFWRLVWDQQSHTIVMLTNCVESGRVKCEHYWPLDAKPCSHGRLRVTLKGEDVAQHWTIRDLQLFHMDLKESLFVRQFHYTVWPDHGVPRSPDPLLAFQALFQKWLDQSPGGGPPIVHCSAGVGRTGTFIALNVLLRQLQKYQQVGVQSFVGEMRKSRPLMVQTEGQYIFLYQALMRFLQLSQNHEGDGRDQEGALYENVEAIRAYQQETGVS
ncbi:receptor-type tyrosine-protein phosphatase H [Dromiciops gliroides]|uniref:receptor-type tyrosine-protein phosphatase H n=1 Tax=Dromiciops gliroides TaxID=33562 RepID=UPI001CC3A947|nr:receptor-type tyrosine-protein phosphatase H [Dromiciops gliroides]